MSSRCLSSIGDISSATQTPPGMRKANFREALSLLQAPRQVGIPATLNTDANLGFAFYAYQSASVALPSGETHRRILLRVEGKASRGGSGQGLQRAKVGYCPCCSIVTHIAVPPSYDAGPFDEAKCTSTSLWQQWGPWASRYLAAHHYYNAYGALSHHWDWAAHTLDIATPSPLSLSKLQDVPLQDTPHQIPVHVSPSPRSQEAQPMDLTQTPAPGKILDPPSPLGDPNEATTHLPIKVNLSSCIPKGTLPDTPGKTDPAHAPRDLSQFLVDDNSPLTSRSTPQCSDGRNLSFISSCNYPRGGHRLDPSAPPSSEDGHSKSTRTPKGSPGPGKPAVRPISPSSVTGYGKTKANKTKADFYLHFLGKGKSTSKENELRTPRDVGEMGKGAHGK